MKNNNSSGVLIEEGELRRLMKAKKENKWLNILLLIFVGITLWLNHLAGEYEELLMKSFEVNLICIDNLDDTKRVRPPNKDKYKEA